MLSVVTVCRASVRAVCPTSNVPWKECLVVVSYLAHLLMGIQKTTRKESVSTGSQEKCMLLKSAKTSAKKNGGEVKAVRGIASVVGSYTLHF